MFTFDVGNGVVVIVLIAAAVALTGILMGSRR